MYNFPEQLSGPYSHGSEDVDVNGDQLQTMDVPVIMPTDLDDKSTKVACGRVRVMKRFRRWARKRLRSICCVCISRDDSSYQKDACRVDDIGNNEKGLLNNSSPKKPKNGYETKINEISSPLIITNESNTVLNSVHSAQNFPENLEIVFESNEDDNNTDLLCNNISKMPESNSPRENGKRRDESISVNTAESLVSETDKCDGIVKTTKSTTSLQIDNTTRNKIVSIVTTASQSIRNEHYFINSINHENISEINYIKLSHENIQKKDEQNLANDVDHSFSKKYKHTQLQAKPTESRKLYTDYEREFVFRTKAANHIIRKQNPITMPSYEDLPCSHERNFQRSNNQARSERSSINGAESRGFEEYERSHLQMISTASRKLDIDSKRDFVFKTKSANHVLRKQQDPLAVPLYNVRPYLQDRNLQRDNEQTENKQNSVNKTVCFKKQKPSHPQTTSMMSRKSDIDSKRNLGPISAVTKYHFEKRQEAVTTPRYENLTGSQERKLQRDNEQSSVNKTEPCIFKNQKRSHMQTISRMSRKSDIDSKGDLVPISAVTKYHFEKRQKAITTPRYENLTGSQERKLKRDTEQTGEAQNLVNKAEPLILENRDRQQDIAYNTSVHGTQQDSVGNNATHQGHNDQLS